MCEATTVKRSSVKRIRPRGSEASRELPRLERRVLTEDVYETIKTLVMDHVAAPGERLNMDELARAMQVSQTPVREALARLEADGLVTKEPLRGYSATPLLTPLQLEEVFELRLLLEPWAAGRAAERATPAGAADLEEELASCPAAPAGTQYMDYRELSAHDARLHELIATLAGNRALSSALEHAHVHLHLFRLRYRGTMGAEALAEHRRLVAAIVAQDPAEAERAMADHVRASRNRLRSFGFGFEPS